jgi:hypothetical protein
MERDLGFFSSVFSLRPIFILIILSLSRSTTLIDFASRLDYRTRILIVILHPCVHTYSIRAFTNEKACTFPRTTVRL